MNASLLLPGVAQPQMETVSDEQLLCHLFGDLAEGSGVDRRLEIARRLLARFGGWKGVLSALPEDLFQVAGMGPGKLSRLMVLQEVVRRATTPEGYVRSDTDAVKAFEFLRRYEQEVVAAAFLRADNETIVVKEIFRGTVAESPSQPREILRAALAVDAVKLILAHNHTGRDAEPSDADRRFTVRLQWAAEAVGLEVLDHVIVARGGASYSFAQAGLMSPRKPSKSCFRPSRRRFVR